MKQSHYVWRKVVSALPELPSLLKYPEETWEWTIGRDYKDRLGETGANILELALRMTDSGMCCGNFFVFIINLLEKFNSFLP